MACKASLRYFEHLEIHKTEKPYQCVIAPWHVPEARKSNVSFVSHTVELNDMLPHINDFTTDNQGFEVATLPTALSNADIQRSSVMPQEYEDECTKFLLEKFGAHTIHIFDYTLRMTDPPRNSSRAEMLSEQILKPAHEAHVDQTPDSVRRRILHQYSEDGHNLLKGRVRVINIWRPLCGPIVDSPLAMCDYWSTKAEDYVASDLPAPDWEGESFLMAHNPKHKWWYLSTMQRDEVLLLKCYDSAAEVPGSTIALGAPHTSVALQEISPEAKARESVEIRAIVFSEK